MKKSAYIRFSLTLFIIFAMLSPTAILAAGGDGKKHFKEGMKHEDAEEWDQAVENFALAVMESPKNPEYRLHYVRSLFNASQMFMRRGNSLAEKEDYAGAYLAFRKAYAYDPVNELAKSEMERMLRLQKVENGEESEDRQDVKLIQTKYKGVVIPDDVIVPQRLEVLGDVIYPSGIDIQFLIKDLASKLDLNVLFDTESFRQDRKVKIELRNVTAAKALDYLFLQEGLFFEKVGPRTILVANQTQRQKFQQLVLRTFYLANASPKDVSNVVKTAIPAQPGRTPTIVLTDDATNSITIRDTAENIRLIGKLINSLDKDRAEVVMDVAIYEVTKTDLLQFGNQFGDQNSLINLGGSTPGVLTANKSPNLFKIPQTFGVGLILPSANLIALQSKNNTKLIASTQIHSFNNEDSSARIGQRVPVQTASVIPFSNNGNNGNNGGAFGGNGFPVINYEQVGLTLKFKPIVFPNKDVQVSMEIESKDVAAGPDPLTPVFTERTIKGTARVQNNKTLLLASVAQNVETKGRQGLPILGLIPIIGRLFTAPRKDNRQTDIVIAITPRVIRAPAILPEDLEERPTGSLAVPTSGSLEAMIIQDEIDEQLAMNRQRRRTNTNADVQLPDQPTYVRSDELPKTDAVSENTEDTSANIPQNKPETIAQTPVKIEQAPVKKEEKKEAIIENNTANIDTNITKMPKENVAKDQTTARAFISDQTKQEVESEPIQNTILESASPIDTSMRTLQLVPTVGDANSLISSKKTAFWADQVPAREFSAENPPTAELQILPGVREMKAGEKTRIAIIVKSDDSFRSAVLGLRFDGKKLAVRKVGLGDVFGEGSVYKTAKPFFNEDGKMFVSLSTPNEVSENSSGVLAYVEIEALTSGKHEITFERDIMNFLTSTGTNFALKF
jgi:general secretion pathway protein D